MYTGAEVSAEVTDMLTWMFEMSIAEGGEGIFVRGCWRGCWAAKGAAFEEGREEKR